MANKRGGQRLKSLVPRQPNGQPRRPTLNDVKQAERAARMKEVSFVANQPHRRGDDHPMASSAVGRVVRRIKGSDELFQAAQKYEKLNRSWALAVNSPRGFANEDTFNSGGGDGPSQQTIDGWNRKLRACEYAVSDFISPYIMQNLILFDQDQHVSLDAAIGRALYALSVEFGMSIDKHPFLQAAQ
jgi:hypothetical protein